MKTRNGSPWIDPAPLEVERPRVPWWGYVPGWWKVLAAPIALGVATVWLLVRVCRLVWRYPIITIALLLITLTYVHLGHWPVVGISLAVAVGAGVWWWRDRASFTRWVALPVRSEWRRFRVYATDWRSVMRLASLTKDARGREYRPGLVRVRCEGWRDVVRVRMIAGQAPEQWEQRASGLAHSFKARSCRVRVVKPGTLALDFVHTDPLVRTLPAPALATEVGDVVELLSGVDIGLTESGRPWLLRLLGNQVLVVGVQGAGKGSVLWSVLRRLAPAIRAGLVRVVGIDPKGGMELGTCPEVFSTVVYDNGEHAVRLLETMAAEVKRRADRYRGVRRKWTPDTGDPFLLLVIDELADVIAYQTDRKLKERAQLALQTITSQGRAPGVCVLGLVQDPRKDIVPFRNLFTTRVALRLDEAAQVDMVLGDGVRERGARADEISENTPGVAWIKQDGIREPIRARATFPTDDDLADLAGFVTGRTGEVVPFPGGGGAAA